MNCFQTCLHVTVNSLVFLRLPARQVYSANRVLVKDPREQAFPRLRKSPWPVLDWGHQLTESGSVEAVIG